MDFLFRVVNFLFSTLVAAIIGFIFWVPLLIIMFLGFIPVMILGETLNIDMDATYIIMSAALYLLIWLGLVAELNDFTSMKLYRGFPFVQRVFESLRAPE